MMRTIPSIRNAEFIFMAEHSLNSAVNLDNSARECPYTRVVEMTTSKWLPGVPITSVTKIDMCEEFSWLLHIQGVRLANGLVGMTNHREAAARAKVNRRCDTNWILDVAKDQLGRFRKVPQNEPKRDGQVQQVEQR